MTTFRQLVASERPLVLPGAHDAISARLIERAGFKAYFIGGFPLVGARFGLPDIGLMGLGEIGSGIRDIMSACDLPVLVDCDNGYGDVKTVVHVINFYERLGAQAVFFEDQVSPKRCGHISGKRLLDPEQMEANIRAAAENRVNSDTFIIARTDAREVYGLDEALRRGERYVRAGADALFIEAPTSYEEMRTIGMAFDVPQLAHRPRRLVRPLQHQLRSSGHSVPLQAETPLIVLLQILEAGSNLVLVSIMQAIPVSGQNT